MSSLTDLLVVSNIDHKPGRYVIADAHSGRVLVGPFHSVLDASVLAQSIANQQKTRVWQKAVTSGSHPSESPRLFHPADPIAAGRAGSYPQPD